MGPDYLYSRTEQAGRHARRARRFGLRQNRTMGIMEWVMGFLQSLQGAPAYGVLFGLLFASGFGLPINEDILLLAAAALTLRGVMEPVPLIAVAWFGVLCADALVFHWGHVFGARVLRHPHLARFIPEQRLAVVQQTMLRYGPAYMFLVRFMPGLRTTLFFAAGSLKTPYRYLFLFDGAAALVELPLLVYGVRYLGGRWQDIMAGVQRLQGVLIPGAVLLGLALCLYVWQRRKRAS